MKLQQATKMRSPNIHQADPHTPTTSLKHYHPYFTPAEIEYLSDKHRGKQSVAQEEKVRQSACTFLESIGARVGL